MRDLGTDSAALRRRIEAHRRFARHEINDWIFGITRPLGGERALDVGCGTGKQLLSLAERVGEAGVAVGLDSSEEALAAARSAARDAALGRVRLVQAQMEDLASALPPEIQYDLILCSFALYYSTAPERTVWAFAERLAPRGRVFVCGPARENNRGFLDFCDASVPPHRQPHRREVSLVFMDEVAPHLLGEVFGQVELFRFENPLVFPAPEDVLAYWRSYHLYDPAHEGAFQDALERHFAAHGRFVTHKVVRGALAR